MAVVWLRWAAHGNYGRTVAVHLFRNKSLFTWQQRLRQAEGISCATTDLVRKGRTHIYFVPKGHVFSGMWKKDSHVLKLIKSIKLHRCDLDRRRGS